MRQSLETKTQLKRAGLRTLALVFRDADEESCTVTSSILLFPRKSPFNFAGMPPSDRSAPLFSRKILAYSAPMIVFVLLLTVPGLVREPGAAVWRSAPEFWVYPLQTFLCGALLVFFWRDYEFQSLRRPVFTAGLALLAFFIWISPQQFLHAVPRVHGFNPDTIKDEPTVYGSTVLLRFLRLVVVVPLLEEIFWRGFLLRYFIAERFETVPLGTFSLLSFSVVTFAFCFSHSAADWPAALITGALYNVVIYRTRSLSSAVFAHSLTNLTLGLWIMATKEWGFW